jgi:shikimate kinase
MWLIGMMGSGKTTVGRQAASRLGVPFYDTDVMVVDLARMPVSAIWEGAGEDGFRELERWAVARVPTSGVIAAAGGGAVLDESNRARMTEGAPVIWLKCPPSTLARRLSGDTTRPLLENDRSPAERLADILERRFPLYQSLATDEIETDAMDVDRVIDTVIEIWQR